MLLRVLSHAVRTFAVASRTPTALFDAVVREVAENLACACTLSVLDEDGEHFTTVQVHAPSEPILVAMRAQFMGAGPQRIDAHPGIKHVVATKASFFVPVIDAETLAHASDDVAANARDTHATSVIVTPLFSQGRVVGALGLTRHGDAPALGKEELALAEALAEHVGLAFTTARLFEQLDRELAEREALAARLRESEAAHRLLFDASPIPLIVFDIATFEPLAVNDAALELYGYTRREMMSMKVTELAAEPDEAAKRSRAVGDDEASGTWLHRRKDGRHIVVAFARRTLMFAGRDARISVVQDITERIEADRTRALLAAIVESSNDAIVSKRLDGTITSWNEAAERLFGYTAAEILGKRVTVLFPPERLAEEEELLARITAGERVAHYETVRRRKDGTDVDVSVSLSPVRDASGAVIGASKTVRDLTPERKAKQILARTEEQLQQAEKMDAVGRLAGGVAHDFNNLLSVILSLSEIVAEDMLPTDPARGDIAEIHKAATRAAELTRQLLLFSRQQIVMPKVIDLDAIVAGMDKFLRRIVGEDVDLVSSRENALWRVRADPGQIEQVIMNLVVNARDAMPTGGKLTIETKNAELDADYTRLHLGVTPGPHVMLAVSDTGIGMDAATQARIFEPFFTTKEGKGTGLGLSIVFGIARQCGGSVWVYSEPGRGTTFKVYFPRVDGDTAVARETSAPKTLRGTETVLLVEDQEQVRAVALGILKRSGYHVLVAQNAGEALLMCEKHPGKIHLLLTDVVMPQMSGTELARRLAQTRADMKVLCMSGYTDDSIVRHGVLESGVAFLQKPFSPQSLTRKVREVLDAVCV
jgi:PAS domain S-box-containing protein